MKKLYAAVKYAAIFMAFTLMLTAASCGGKTPPGEESSGQPGGTISSDSSPTPVGSADATGENTEDTDMASQPGHSTANGATKSQTSASGQSTAPATTSSKSGGNGSAATPGKDTTTTATAAQPMVNTVYIDKKDDVIQAVHKYSPTHDFVMVFKKMGTNSIFNIASPLAIKNSGTQISSNLSAAALLGANLGESDWFGPHIINARNNADGDRKQGEFTGGNHNYFNGTSPGSATGTTTRIELRINGQTISGGSFSGYAGKVDIYWDNAIQAANTKKADGSGRAVLVERFHASYSGDRWDISCELEFLEDVLWMRYYGLQCIYGSNWGGEIQYGDGSWLALNANTNGPRKCDAMRLRSNRHYLEMRIDNGYGIGDRSHVTGNGAGAFTQHVGNGKAYFSLCHDYGTVRGGVKLNYRGSYRFYYV